MNTAHPEPRSMAASGDERSPLVSVVLPTFNRAALISHAIDAVLSQTFTDFELIIVDDGSTDDTCSAVRGVADSRVRYISLPENRGQSFATNVGIDEAIGEYVAFIDSDDDWAPQKLEKQVQVMRHSDLTPGMVYTGINFVRSADSVNVRVRERRGHLFEAFAKHQDVINYRQSCCLWRRSVLHTIGGLDEKLFARKDYDMTIRGLLVTACDYVDEALTNIYVHRAQNRISKNQDVRIQAGHYLLAKYRGMELPYRRHIMAQVATVLGKDYMVRGDRIEGRRQVLRGATLAPLTTLRNLWPGGFFAFAASWNRWTFKQALSRWSRRT